MNSIKKEKYNESKEKYFSNKREEMFEFVNLESKLILECGCGEGHFSSQIKQKNEAEVWGIEFEEQSAEIAKLKLDKVIIGDLNEKLHEVPNDFFDLIIFNDVLEHLPDPWEILRVSKKKLNKKGEILASIPNVLYAGNLKEMLIDKDWRYKKEGGILDYTHLRFFTKKSIERLFQESGYEITQIQGINPIRKFIFHLINIVSFKYFNETKYLQYAVRAKKTI